MSPGASPERRALVRLPSRAEVTVVFEDGSQTFPVTLVDTSSCGGRVRYEAGEFPTPITALVDSSLQERRVYPIWTQTTGEIVETGFLTEEAFINRLRSGETEALLPLLSLHQLKLKRAIRSITRGQADEEDIFQECLLKVIQHTGQLRPGHSFRAWLLRIATHESLKAIQRNKRRLRFTVRIADDDGSGEETDFIDPRGSPSDALEFKELEAEFLSALGSLDEIYKSVFILRQLHELSMAEVAAELHIKVDTANTRLRRARMCLYDQLREACRNGSPVRGRSLLESSRNGHRRLVTREWLATH
jgi:RNA polymerase sigma-70 factor (ECF subfamily)